MVARNEFVQYVRSLEGYRQDTDGVYGAQCVDLITHVQKKFWGRWVLGNAIDFASNELLPGWTRGNIIDMGFAPGDILVWRWDPNDPYGHIGIGLEGHPDANGIIQEVTSLEQNVDGNADYLVVGGPARMVRRSLAGCVAVLRPGFESGVTHKPATDKFYDEVGTATVNVELLNVRREPNTKGDIVATYKLGDKIAYDKVIVDANGFVWISFVGKSSGKRNYVATGATHEGVRYGQPWCDFA